MAWTSDDGRGAVVPQSQPGGDARGDGDDILECATQLHADHIIVGIEPQCGRAELLLQPAGQPAIGESEGDCRGGAGCHFLRERRPAQRAAGQAAIEISLRQHLLDDLRHAQEALVLDSLGGADDDLPRPKKGRHGVIDRAHMLRRHGTDHNLRAHHGYGQIRYVIYLRRNGKPGKVGAHRCRMRPQGDGVVATARQAQGESGSPGAAAHNSNTAHAPVFLDAPKPCSVPCRRRWIFCQCFTMTIQQQTKTTTPEA